MVFKSIIIACLTTASLCSNASIISTNWQTAGDNFVTRDTDSGLDWLDVSLTAARSYNDISSKFGTGQEFAGWRYATRAEIGGFWDAFGGNSAFYAGFSTENNGLLSSISPFWSETACHVSFCAPGDGYTRVLSADISTVGVQHVSMAFDSITSSSKGSHDLFDLSFDTRAVSEIRIDMGSALVRTSVVPVPAAVWLFGSGLLGLNSISRRKKS